MKNEDDLICNLKYYYDRSIEVVNDFGGPSVYFHTQAIQEQKENFLSDRHIEMIYATLSSWGMHRMGDPKVTKAKMVEFDDFKRSIRTHGNHLQRMRFLAMDSSTLKQYKEHLNDLKEVYFIKNSLTIHITISPTAPGELNVERILGGN